MFFKRTALVAAVLAVGTAHAAVDVTSTSFSYSQSFDTLAASGTSVAWVNDSTLKGWSLFNSAGTAITSYLANDGSSNSGGFVSYGTTGSTERALGGLGSGGTYFGSPASGAVAGYIAASFSNASGAKLDSFTLDFDGEQWRNGGNATAQPMTVQYGFGSSFSAVSTWTTLSSLSWSSPVNSATAASVNGNVAGLVSLAPATVAVNWAASEVLWVRWTERNDVGNDHGLAIDNFSLSVAAVPEPSTYAMLLAGIVAIGLMVRERQKSDRRA